MSLNTNIKNYLTSLNDFFTKTKYLKLVNGNLLLYS